MVICSLFEPEYETSALPSTTALKVSSLSILSESLAVAVKLYKLSIQNICCTDN